jgi:hypothetical protein
VRRKFECPGSLTFDAYLTRASDSLSRAIRERDMDIWTSSREALEEALIDLGFSAAREFGIFVTYERPRGSVKVHVAPDGMFAAFEGDGDILGEGVGAEELRSVLREARSTAASDTPHRLSFLSRRRRTKGSSSRPVARARSSLSDRAEQAPAALSANAFSN